MGRLKVWNPTTSAWEYAAAAYHGVYVQPGAPTSPNVGDLWFDTDDTTVDTQFDPALLATKAATNALVDAKGDLLVGTANDTLGRLAVGTDGHDVMADSNATTGVRYSRVLLGMYAAARFTIPIFGRANSLVVAPGTAGKMVSTLIIIPRRLTVDQVNAVVGTLSVGELLRIGLYSDASGQPGSLIVDWGTIDATTTGQKSITVSTVLDPGVYWITWVPQNALNAARYTGLNNSGASWSPFSWSANTTDGTVCLASNVTTTTGALPASYGAIDVNGSTNMLMIALRMA